MCKLQLALACEDYDRTCPLIDGRVQAEGVDLNIKVMGPRENFPRMIDVCRAAGGGHNPSRFTAP